MDSPTLIEILQESTFPLPKLPVLSRDRSWDTTFTHKSLPDSNLVLAALGHSVFQACVTEWLLDADPLVTQSELEARTAERVDPELLSAFSDVYALPPQLKYARGFPYSDRFTLEDRVQVFAAYVGAVQRDQGFETVKQWVYELMEWDNLTMIQSLHE